MDGRRFTAIYVLKVSLYLGKVLMYVQHEIRESEMHVINCISKFKHSVTTIKINFYLGRTVYMPMGVLRDLIILAHIIIHILTSIGLSAANIPIATQIIRDIRKASTMACAVF